MDDPSRQRQAGSGLRLPRALSPGDTVALICPASPPRCSADWDLAIRQVTELGFRAHLGPVARLLREGGVRGSAAERARELMNCLLDPAFQAVWAVRGGYGCLPLLEHLDFECLVSVAKPLLGFSDLCVLIQALHRHTGLVTFHAPMPTQQLTQSTRQEFLAVIGQGQAAGQVGLGLTSETAERCLRPGVVRGPLLPANLSMLTHLCGTPHRPEFFGRILCLEEVNEAPYRVHRALTQLRLCGCLQDVAGVALGSFREQGKETDQDAFDAVFQDRLGDLGVPVFRGLPFGHISQQTTLPVGVAAEIDAVSCTLRILDPAVRQPD